MSIRWWHRCIGIVALAAALSLGTTRPAHAWDQELKALAAKLSVKIANDKKTNLAVVDLVNLEGTTTLLGRFLAEELANDLGNSDRGFEIVDRNHLNSLMKESKLSANGFIDKLTATKLGSMTGAQALMLGTITPFGESLRITVKVLDTKTSKLIAAETIEFANTHALEDMYGKPLPDEPSQPAAAAKTAKAASVQKAAPTEETEDSEAETVIEDHNLRFQLGSCERGGQTITCRLTVQSLSYDVNLALSAQTRVFDEKGGEFKASEIKIANGGQKSCCTQWEKSIVAGVNTPISIVFESGAEKPQKLSAFDIEFVTGSSGQRKITFRNIPLSARSGGKTAVAASGKHNNAGGGTDDADESLLDSAIGSGKTVVRSLFNSLAEKVRKKANLPNDDGSNGDADTSTTQKKTSKSNKG
ncbi:MAG TPA: FlgO family outer membrane protein [Thermoanaerobaculia bacterium]|jgi:TolB-like protein|nr:FlgO family outer membrane protein [Thermoanaerobaculia bacterium]